MEVQVTDIDINYYNLSIRNTTPSGFIDITFNKLYFKTLEDIKEMGPKVNPSIEVKNTKQLRKDIDRIIQHAKTLESCREVNIAIIKLQESVMWLGMNLKRLNDKDPYPESKNPESSIIEPTADGLKF